MPTARAPILAIVLLLLARDAYGVKRVTVDAANRNLDDFLTLYGGGDYLMLVNNMEEETGRISDVGYPDNFPFTASAETYDDAKSYLYGPDFYYTFYMGNSKHYYSGEAKSFLQHGGPDAVAECNNEMYYFKGCSVAKEDGWSSASNVKDYGLPCSPDAAWKTSNADGMVVLKGDQIWLWDCKGKVSEKKAFSSVYHISSWELIP